MTWAEFVEKVERQLAAKGYDRSVEVACIDWDVADFGGPAPDIYVNDKDEHGRIYIGED